jgi:hypothetical protein
MYVSTPARPSNCATPVAGDIEVTGEALDIPADPGLTIIAYTVEPASQSADALRFLASWSAEQLPSATCQKI